MPRKIILAALLCLALCQTAKAQILTDDPALNTAIMSVANSFSSGIYQVNIPSIQVFFYKKNFNCPTADGKEYAVVGFVFYNVFAAANNVQFTFNYSNCKRQVCLQGFELDN